MSTEIVISSQRRLLLPPFTLESATEKVQKAEDAWNSCDVDRCAAAYTEDSVWRNRAEFFSGRVAIREFLQRKWAKELDYRLRKELWSFTDNRISVRFVYEWHDTHSQWLPLPRQRAMGVRRARPDASA